MIERLESSENYSEKNGESSIENTEDTTSVDSEKNSFEPDEHLDEVYSTEAEESEEESGELSVDESNKKLGEAMKSDDELAEKFDAEQKSMVSDGYTPRGYSWRDDSENGKRQLVKTEDLYRHPIEDRGKTDSTPSFRDVMSDPDIFSNGEKKGYDYDENEFGKGAKGVLRISDDPHRNATAQRNAGGLDRRRDDDGGHLIGARFDGSPDSENLDAQNRNLNRGAYKRLEDDWADSLKDGDKVYVNVETYKQRESDRPDAYMGWTVTETPDGKRHGDFFSFTNESSETQDAWSRELEEEPDTSDVPNAMNDEDYERIHQFADEEDEGFD